MGFQENVERLIEERQAEAVKKDLTRKIRMIVKTLGFAVRDKMTGSGSQGGIGHATYEAMDDYWNDDSDEESMPTDEDLDSSAVLAYAFDGLSSGINMQILFNEQEEMVKTTYEGTEVYKEVQGKLQTYIPSPMWEVYVESLFRMAQKNAKIEDQADKEDKQAENSKIKDRLLEYLRKHWGV